MARFDIYEHTSRVPFLLDLQADLLTDLKTRAVVPLLPYAQARKQEMSRLMPVLTVRGKRCVMMTQDISSVKVSELGKLVENIEPQRRAIIDAVDFLFQGF